MAKHTDQRAGDFETENTGGFLAEEDELDRRSLWRIGSWGFAAVGAVVVALLANQSSTGLRREQIAADELARQAQLIRSAARESQHETKRLASAVDTLNSDRDRLYSRVTVLEQGLDSVTGAIGRQTTAAASPTAPASPATTEPAATAQNPSPAPAVAPAATTAATSAETSRAATTEPAPATIASVAPGTSNAPAPTPAMPLMASKSIMAPPDPAAGKLIEPETPPSVVTAQPIPEVVAAASSADNAESDAPRAPKLQRTDFGVDVGGANSVNGLRALWRGLLKSRANAPLAALRPIIVVKESSSGLGMQLRLVAGPLGDAAAAARICATLIENDRTCQTTVFDGQRLAIKAEDPPASVKPTPSRRRIVPKRAAVNEEPPKKPETSTISALFGRKNSSQ
jgi:hypothetical protein